MEGLDQIKKLLQQNLEVSRESLKILKKLHRAKKLALTFKILYWTVIVAMILGAYYYIQPIIGEFVETFGKIKADISALQNLSMPR